MTQNFSLRVVKFFVVTSLLFITAYSWKSFISLWITGDDADNIDSIRVITMFSAFMLIIIAAALILIYRMQHYLKDNNITTTEEVIHMIKTEFKS